MLEILAAYLFFKCYVLTGQTPTNWEQLKANVSGSTTQQCINDFKADVERWKASQTAARVYGWYWRVRTSFASRFDEPYLRAAAALTREQLEQLGMQVLLNVQRSLPR
jgi:hypothetical protein